MAAGKVLTGFSMPYVALYTVGTNGTVTYTNAQQLARGVSVSIAPEVADDAIFYADNVAAENVGGKFSGGTITLTVDGLTEAAAELILGLPEPESVTVGTSSVDVYNYGEAQSIPYVGIGYIARYLSDGVESYVPTVIKKARFKQPGDEAATSEDAINFQTQTLEASIMRDDTDEKNWKAVGAGQTTEAAALNVVKVLLGATVS